MSEGRGSDELGMVAQDRRLRRDRNRRLQTLSGTEPDDDIASQGESSTETDVPRHVCIIADGNENWLRVVEDGELYERTLRRISVAVDHLVDCGSEYVTISMFSKIDWRRADDRLARLIGALTNSIRRLAVKAKDRGYRIKRIGTLDRLPERYGHVAEAFAAAEAETASASRATLVLPFDYSGREEICRAFIRMGAAGITADAADGKAIRDHLDDSEIPNPDIVVQLAGGLSLSDVYAFQSEYAALYFLEDVAPPDLTVDVIDRVLRDHAGGYYYSQGRPSYFDRQVS